MRAPPSCSRNCWPVPVLYSGVFVVSFARLRELHMMLSLFGLRNRKSALSATGTSRARPRTFRPRLEALEDRTVPAVLHVTTLADSGAGSLRQAISDANDTDADTIVFDTAGTINVLTQLPALNGGNTTIDGTTAPGFAGTPLVVLNGPGTDTLSGLRVTS